MNQQPNQPPFPESYWVIQGQFLAGRHPVKRLFSYKNHLQSLLDTGIGVFIDLSDGVDYSDDLASLDNSALNGAPQYLRFPITDYHVPDKEFMVSILDAIDLAIHSGKKVYLHCLAGQGRTGTVVGCYLARHGITGTAALERIRQLRSDVPGDFDSPESDLQKLMVVNWQQGQ